MKGDELQRDYWVLCFILNAIDSAVFGCCKTFSEKYVFSGNANFQKRKIFPCVWLHFKKFSGKYFLVFGKEEGKHKSRKTQATQPRKNSSTTTNSRSTARSRSREGEIVIDGSSSWILRSSLTDLPLGSLGLHTTCRNLGSARSRRRSRSRSGACDQRRDLATARSRSSPLLSRARALSLSLIFQKCFEGKIEV